MRVKRPDAKVAALLAAVVAVIIVLVPFHAFLTVWLAGIFGHYVLLRLWKEILLFFLACGGVYLLYKDPKLRWKLISYKLHWFLLAYLVVHLIWGIVALLTHAVTAEALGYAFIVNLRFLAFFLVVSAIAGYVPSMAKHWPKWVIWPLVVVIVFGLLQYFVLPYDFLSHVGYNENTIFPYETINHNIHHLRIMSTLRGANPLGAYLVVVLSLVGVMAWKRKSVWLSVLLAAGLLALFLSFSRGAWIGMILSFLVIGWNLLPSARARRYAVSGVLVFALIGGLVAAALWHNTTFQDTVFHTNSHSTVKVSSNQGHESALKNGVMDLLRQPFGRGPGTAGPASVYNDHSARIAENYFIQIGQEAGWIGLLLFVAINVVVARALWRRREQTLALGLVASLVGISFINLLSHAWADDTLAYIWWGLAGIAITSELGAKDEI